MASKASFKYEPFGVTEEEFSIENNYRNETIFSQANGYLGTRGTFEENYNFNKGTGLEGTFINGFYESETIRYGEFNFGFPQVSQSMLNIVNAKIIELEIDGEKFDMQKGKVTDYRRHISFESGVLDRQLVWTTSTGKKKLRIVTKRLLSYTTKELMVISYEVTPLNFSGEVKLTCGMNAKVMNQRPRITH